VADHNAAIEIKPRPRAAQNLHAAITFISHKVNGQILLLLFDSQNQPETLPHKTA